MVSAFLVKYFYKFRWSLFSSLAVLCFFNIARGYLLPDLMRLMFDMDVGKILYLLLLLHLSVCGSSCLSLYLGNITFKCRARYQIYNDIFDELLKKDCSYYDKPSADLVKRINDLAIKMPEVLINIFIDILSILIGALGISVGLLKDGVFFSVSVIFVFMLFTGIAIGFMRITSSSYLNYSNAYARLSGKLGDWVGNIIAVKLFSDNKLEKIRFSKEFAEVYEFDKAKEWNEVLFTICLNSIYFIILIAQVLFMILRKDTLRVQDILMILTIYLKIYDDLFWYIIFLAKAFEGYFYCAQAIDILYSGKHDVGKSNLNIKGGIQALQISFRHNNRQILNKLCFEILPGEKVVIMGRSGVGKSTIINLIAKILSPSQGKIMLDSDDLQSMKQDALMHHISVVPQDCIFEQFNIKNLSTGERQRFILHKALERNPKILLLDEPTSGLDAQNTEAIGELIAGLSITVLATSHSKDFARYFDRILILRDGKIIEDSNP